MPAPPPRRRGRGGISLGDHLVARTASPTRRHPTTDHRPHSTNTRGGTSVDLRVTGWRDSRVGAEGDGGVATFSTWLERKAQTALDKDAAAAASGGVHKRRHAARIRKVCLIYPQVSGKRWRKNPVGSSNDNGVHRSRNPGLKQLPTSLLGRMALFNSRRTEAPLRLSRI
jgi:hypothetical protein